LSARGKHILFLWQLRLIRVGSNDATPEEAENSTSPGLRAKTAISAPSKRAVADSIGNTVDVAALPRKARDAVATVVVLSEAYRGRNPLGLPALNALSR
jgi:hypothetical protein